MADFFELLSKRRSIRDFEEKEVPRDLIVEMINDSCLAPSSGNEQPWIVVVVANNRDLIKRLSDESKLNLLDEIEKNPNTYLKKYQSALRNEEFNVFYNAPSLVFVGGQTQKSSLEVDCALFAGYFMFSAVERGLGTCWVNLGLEIRDYDLRREIGMPKDFRIVAPIILGYPKGIPDPPPRKEPQILKMV
ncbi:MAG: nitroreductase family protein [Proteobacteria bacterium]|nr:nitroreductase family protein [Pseudomonadota bacterium]